MSFPHYSIKWSEYAAMFKLSIESSINRSMYIHIVQNLQVRFVSSNVLDSCLCSWQGSHLLYLLALFSCVGMSFQLHVKLHASTSRVTYRNQWKTCKYIYVACECQVKIELYHNYWLPYTYIPYRRLSMAYQWLLSEIKSQRKSAIYNYNYYLIQANNEKTSWYSYI